MSVKDDDRLKAQQDWIKMNKVRLDEIERNKRRDLRLLIVLNLVSLILSGLILYKLQI